MPVYEYRCKDCGKTHEIEHGFHDARPTSCPSCGGHLARVFHPVGVVFKGSGFHKTDYSSSGRRQEPSTESKTAGADTKTETSKAEKTKTDAGSPAKPESGSTTTKASGDSKPSGDSKTSKRTST
ncbi:MAG: zinc ribbon domain-containing protein [Candidatus Eremiobacteraeota bacterium]|nr:zinc ribbon domain-containing protein [Candidatus Eremiobacteraeota bacterium]